MAGGGHRLRERRPREQPFRILEQRHRLLRHLDAVVVEPPQERRDRDVEHRVLLSQHVLVLREHRRDLHEAVADEAARLFQLLLVVALERVDVRERAHERAAAEDLPLDVEMLVDKDVSALRGYIEAEELRDPAGRKLLVQARERMHAAFRALHEEHARRAKGGS